jgi:NAD(P)H-hydrate repair Nnr-like enzyme with NAD(P)H-hydrate dehydratase domain
MQSIVQAWRRLSLAQGIVLCVLIASVAATVIAAPEHLWDKLAETSPMVIGGWITTVGGSLIALIAQARPASSAQAPAREERETIVPPAQDADAGGEERDR